MAQIRLGSRLSGCKVLEQRQRSVTIHP